MTFLQYIQVRAACLLFLEMNDSELTSALDRRPETEVDLNSDCFPLQSELKFSAF